MIELLTMVIVFGSIIAIVAIVSWFSYKEEELKTSLRLREMEAGFEPGTYSRISKRDLRRARRMAKRHPEWAEEESEAFRRRGEAEERQELMKGIADLKARIDDIDTIMSRRRTEDEKND